MTGLWHELRFGVRILTKQHRQFALVAVLILAAGVGTTTAVFSVVNAVLLRPLPYREPDRLVAITGLFTSPTGTQRRAVVPLTDVAEWRTRSRSFESIGGFAYTQLPVRRGDQSFSPVTALMDPQFLPTLGKPLHLGTFFDPAAKAGADVTAIAPAPAFAEYIEYTLPGPGSGPEPGLIQAEAEVSAPAVTGLELAAEPASAAPADQYSSLADYLAHTPQPLDDEEFDQYLLRGGALDTGAADPDDIAVEGVADGTSVDTGPAAAIDYHEDFQALGAVEVGSAVAELSGVV